MNEKNHNNEKAQDPAKVPPAEPVQLTGDNAVQSNMSEGSEVFKATVVSDAAATVTKPGDQLAKDEAEKDETENRRGRLSSDLLQQKHGLIDMLAGIIGFVIISLYSIFIITILCLFLSKEGFKGLPGTAVFLVALTGSIPTILTISLLVGLFGKDKDDKPIDTASLVKIAGELLKYLKSH